MSEWQIGELSRVLRYPQLAKKYGIKKAKAGRLINGLRQKAEFVVLPEILDFSPDPDDNPILMTCVAGKADFLVSVDKRHILIFEKIGHTKILSPDGFLKQVGVRFK
jgi:uncharacterized protein